MAPLTPLEQVATRVSRLLAASPADETAVTWVERRQLTTTGKAGAPRAPVEDCEVQVRVLEAGRPGAFRATSADPVDLAVAVRQAMAHARGAPPLAGVATLTPPAATVGATGSHDPALAALDAEAGQELVAGLLGPGEGARLSWSEVAITVATTRGLVRQTRATSARVEVRTRRGPGAGTASAAARSLAVLDPAGVFARARRRDGGQQPLAGWQAPGAVVLAAEAAAALLAALGQELFSATAWEDPRSFGRRHRGVPIAPPLIAVLEDATSPAALALPFSRTGAAAAASVLVEGGVLRGPVADPVWADLLQVPTTAPVWLAEPPRPEHLVLTPGALSEEELVGAAGDGVLVTELERVTVWDPGTLRARLAARGLRRIRGGAVAEPLPNAAWDVALPELLGATRAVGRDLVARAEEDGLAAVAAPGLTLAAAGEWSPLA